MTRRWLALAVLVLVGLCAVLIKTAACVSPTSCAATLVWPLLGVASGGLTAAVVGAAVVRCIWLVKTARHLVDRLRDDPAPPLVLAAASSGLGIRRLRCLASDERLAFTAGILRPCVAVSRGLVDSMAPDSLVAVLAHEAHHAERRDPLRRAIRRAMADVLVVAPIVRWWAEWSAERDELRADRAALRVTSQSAVAEALLVSASPGPSAALAAFDGAADARVAQLLGESQPATRCPWRLLFASLVGAVGVGATAGCAAQLLAMLS